jgi:hypothetical protein
LTFTETEIIYAVEQVEPGSVLGEAAEPRYGSCTGPSN